MPPRSLPAAERERQRERARWRRGLLGTLALLAAVAALLFGALWLLDFFYFAPVDGPEAAAGPVARLLAFDPDTLQSALGNLAQIIAAVLGIAITVVSIVVQLAATRYTPRVADMFFRDRTNLAVMGSFVVACILALWVSLAVKHDHVPVATVLATITIATASLLALIPYFAYVFDFLEPKKVIARIGDQTLDRALGRGLRLGERPAATDLEARQAVTVTSLEQLADIAVNALAQKDKVIASGAITALGRVLTEYLPHKRALTEGWFVLGAALRENHDFVALAPESLAELARGRLWLEWKGLRALRGVFGEALKELPEMTHAVAIESRYVGVAALMAGDAAALDLTVKSLNTYLRAALNARDVRTAYNVLNQYRQLAEALLRAPLPDLLSARSRGDGAPGAERLPTIAGYFKYYAGLARGLGLDFVMETAAYDLGALCELAATLDSPAHDRLLATLLEIDREAETPSEERALRGVRKAQVKLAAHYLACGMTARARQIHRDMAGERPERLRSIREELMAVNTPEFWEIIDRGTNFDYLDGARKAKLDEFFAWFPELGAVAS